MECARRRAARSLRVLCSFVPNSFAEMTSRAAGVAPRPSRGQDAPAPRRTHRRRRDRDYVVKTLARKLIMKSKGVSL